jgi:hypothetical protein
MNINIYMFNDHILFSNNLNDAANQLRNIQLQKLEEEKYKQRSIKLQEKINILENKLNYLTELKDVNLYNISPEKCLYWLSGGDKEWRFSNNYKVNWIDCCLDFQEEFGLKIIAILKKSKTTGQVRDLFSKYLNLPTLFEFSLEKGLI